MMRVGVILVGFVSLVASIYGVVWLLGDGTQSKNAPPSAKTPVTPSDNDSSDGHSYAPSKGDSAHRPIVNKDKSAPQPKAVIEETSFDFGRMELGETQSHVFVIRNEGKAPLAVVK